MPLNSKKLRSKCSRSSKPFANHLWILYLTLAALLATAVGGFRLSSNSLSFTASASTDVRAFLGPDGEILPFKTDEEIKDFLLTAEVVKLEDINIGVADARKAYLEKDGIKAKACFRDIDIHKRREVMPNVGVRRNWRDCCKFECAAYELGQLLGMRNIPPVVMRKIKGTEGSLQLWVEGNLMEADRAKQNIEAPNRWRFQMQWQVKDVFDALIHNDDRHARNFLYDEDWNLWLIDHGRCFPLINDLPKDLRIKHCERNVWNNLQSVDEEVVKERLSPYLTSAELKSLFKRREKLIKYIEDLIEQRGERQVVFSFY